MQISPIFVLLLAAGTSTVAALDSQVQAPGAHMHARGLLEDSISGEHGSKLHKLPRKISHLSDVLGHKARQALKRQDDANACYQQKLQQQEQEWQQAVAAAQASGQTPPEHPAVPDWGECQSSGGGGDGGSGGSADQNQQGSSDQNQAADQSGSPDQAANQSGGSPDQNQQGSSDQNQAADQSGSPDQAANQSGGSPDQNQQGSSDQNQAADQSGSPDQAAN